MIQKFFFFLLTLLIFSSCGYKPIYSTKSLNFSIENIEKNNTFMKRLLVWARLRHMNSRHGGLKVGAFKRNRAF